MKRDKTYINRKIYFYKIHAGRNLAGEPIEYNVKSVLEAINGLSFQTDARYLKDEDGFEICCLIDELSSPQKVRFCKIRRGDFPQTEHRGNLADLEIPEEYGLAECVHAIFFPENIVGLEYNYEGPRTTRISDYLYAKAKNVCAQIPVFEQLLQQDAIKKLEHMRTVRRFRLKVRDSLFSAVKQADESLANAFQAARALGQANEIELILSVGRGKGALASIYGSLLGFVITALSIIIGYSTNEKFEFLRKSKHYPTLWEVLISTIRALSAATVIMVISLVFDRDSSPQYLIFCVCVFTILLSLFRLRSCIWVLENVILIIIKR